MKIIVIVLLALSALVSCSSSKKTSVQKTSPVVINAELIKTSMEYLSSDELEGRQTGTEGIELAAQYIENYLEAHNIRPFFETYRDSFNFNDITGYNIVGMIEGNDPDLKDEYIILGGHYDHIGKGNEVNGDTIANGANDDASGTIAAMELGRYFASSKTNKRSVLITLYSAEEMGLKGSAHLAKRLKSEGVDVYTMINFEMIGVPRSADKAMAYMSGYERSNFASVLNAGAGEEVLGFFPKAKELQLFFRSDNYPFYKELNIPAHAISTFDFTNYDFYHHVDDEADKMDYEHMAKFINKMIPALEGMMNTATKEVSLINE